LINAIKKVVPEEGGGVGGGPCASMRPQHGPWRRCCCTPTLTYGPTFPFVQLKPPEAGERIRAVLSGAACRPVKPTCIVQGAKPGEAQTSGSLHCRQHLLEPRSSRRRWRKTALQGLQGTRRYTNASTRLTVKFRVEKVRTYSVQTPTRPAWPIWASSRNATQPCRAEASLLCNRAPAVGSVWAAKTEETGHE